MVTKLLIIPFLFIFLLIEQSIKIYVFVFNLHSLKPQRFLCEHEFAYISPLALARGSAHVDVVYRLIYNLFDPLQDYFLRQNIAYVLLEDIIYLLAKFQYDPFSRFVVKR